MLSRIDAGVPASLAAYSRRYFLLSLGAYQAAAPVPAPMAADVPQPAPIIFAIAAAGIPASNARVTLDFGAELVSRRTAFLMTPGFVVPCCEMAASTY